MQKIIITLLSILPTLAFGQMSYNGSGNNVSNPEWGSSMSHLERLTSNGYADSISSPAGATRPNPREISNVIFDQTSSIPNERLVSDFGWAFGQFIDHDVTFVDDHHSETVDIPVPTGDPFFDPFSTGTEVIPMKRSVYDTTTGTSTSNPRMHTNFITSWIDASNVYGSDSVRAMWLRSFSDGKLKTSANDFLPFNTTTGELADPIDPSSPFMFNENPMITKFFVAGDVRANEQPILTALHTLFMREHNRICDELITQHPGWNDEQLYQKARRMVSAKVQAIAFYEWLPALGITYDDFTAYDDQLNPNIMNVFSAAAFRLGHTLINSELKRLNEDGDTISYGNINLKDAFFNPHVLINEDGMEPYFRGMVTQPQQNFDTKVISDLRNFLFGPPGAGGLDLVSININRGRERGLVDYNTIRTDMGLTANATFSDITSDVNLQNLLQSVYGTVDDIDPWVGFLAEDHEQDMIMGEAVHSILHHQFHALRDGDRYYFENDPSLTASEISDLKNTKLSHIILDNTSIEDIQANVFFVIPDTTPTGIGTQYASQDLMKLEVYPNPTSAELNINVTTATAEIVEYSLFNELGSLIESRSIYLLPGEQQIQSNVSHLNAGTYFIQVKSKNFASNQKFVKL